ncbi:MAG: ferritin family protein [Candidatus Zixiibacteriota bacterium]
MDIFEYAMQMETDGRSFYTEHAAKATQPELKRILLELADDELKHYNLFKALRDGQPAEYKEASRTRILATLKNVFQEISATNKDFTFGSDARKIWEQAREVEKKSEAFYREQATMVDKPNQRDALVKIADEEHRHWVTLQHVIDFIERPARFIEDAEWSHLEE